MGDASLSSDGANIAFDSDKSGQREIYVSMTRGGPPRKVTDGPGDKYDPRFSPDGTEILYIRQEENTELWKVPTNGVAPQIVLSDVATADWAPDGRRIVCVRQLTDGAPFVAIADKDGQNPIKIFDLQFKEVDHLRCSPDGKWIFLNGDGRAILVPTVGPPIRDLGDQVKVYLGGVEWSKDSGFLFFSKNENGVTNIWRYRLANRTVKRTTTGEGADFDPMPFTDGNGLFYANGRLQKNLWKVALDNKEPSELVGGGWFSVPMVSPDRRRVAYLEEEPGILGTGSIQIVGIDGENQRTIATNGKCVNIAWSPDLRRLAFSTALQADHAKHYNIFVHSLDENRTCQVTFGRANDHIADWSPDGREILFTRDSGEKDFLTMLRLPEGEDCANAGGSESVVAEGLEGLGFSRDGRWILALGSEYVPEDKGLWIVPAHREDGKKRKILSEPVSNARWALGQRAIIYSLVGTHKGNVDLFELPIADGRAAGAPTFLYSFRSTKSGRDEWDITDDLSILVYPKSQSHISFFKRVFARGSLLDPLSILR